MGSSEKPWAFEDHDIRGVAVGVVDIGEDPAVVLGRRALAGDENRLLRGPAGAVVVDFGPARRHVMFESRAKSPRSSQSMAWWTTSISTALSTCSCSIWPS